MKTVNELLRRVWHYFDAVVVTGLDPARCLSELSQSEDARDLWPILGQIQLALYIREIGAEDLLLFRRYPAYCSAHLDQHAKSAGLASIQETRVQLEKRFLSKYELEMHSSNDGSRLISFKSEEMKNRIVSRWASRDVWPDETAIAADMAGHEAAAVVGSFIRDVALARDLRASLGQVATSSHSSLTVATEAPSASQVAFSLPLPVIQSVPISEVLAFRRDAFDDFLAFRTALRKAVGEQVEALANEDAQDVADSILDDIITPSLSRIQKQTVKATNLLAKRGVTSATLGTAVTVVGILSLAPIVVSGIAIGAAGILATANEYLKEQRDIELDDMYFLWKLSQQANDHA